MANDYYTVTYDFEPYTRVASAQVDAELAAIVAGFDLLPSPAQLAAGNSNFIEAGGTADVITAAAPATWTTYVGKDGYRLNIQAAYDNTGATTLNVDSLGAKAVVRNDGSALSARDIEAAGFYDFVYDETADNFKIINSFGVDADASATEAAASAAAAASSETAAAASAATAAAATYLNWVLTPKTSDFDAAANTGYMVDTSGGAITMTLAASPTPGDFVAFKDYGRSFATYNLTLDPNSLKIEGAAENMTVGNNYASGLLQYVDATEGWKVI